MAVDSVIILWKFLHVTSVFRNNSEVEQGSWTMREGADRSIDSAFVPAGNCPEHGDWRVDQRLLISTVVSFSSQDRAVRGRLSLALPCLLPRDERGKKERIFAAVCNGRTRRPSSIPRRASPRLRNHLNEPWLSFRLSSSLRSPLQSGYGAPCPFCNGFSEID